MAANRVLLWRHGQTDWNVVNRFQGHSDIDLNEVGRFQVQHAAQILAGMKPTMIISSEDESSEEEEVHEKKDKKFVGVGRNSRHQSIFIRN